MSSPGWLQVGWLVPNELGVVQVDTYNYLPPTHTNIGTQFSKMRKICRMDGGA